MARFVESQTKLRLGCWGLLIVHTFSRPLWTYFSKNLEGDDFGAGVRFPGYGISRLSPVATVILESICLIICTIGVYEAIQQSAHAGNHKRASILKCLSGLMIVAKAIEILVNIVSIAGEARRPRVTLSPLEAILLISVEPCFQSSLYVTIAQVLPFFFGLVAILVCIIASWSAFAMVVINDGPEELQSDPYFFSFDASFWHMLTVLNAADWPGPMIPSYSLNRGYFYFFMLYVVVVQWFFLSLILGLIIGVFQETWENTISSDSSRQTTEAQGTPENVLLAESPTPAGVIIDPPISGKTEEPEPSSILCDQPLNADALQADAVAPSVVTSASFDYLVQMRAVHETFAFKAGADALIFSLGLAFCLAPEPQIVLLFLLILQSVETGISYITRKEKESFPTWFARARNMQNTLLFGTLLTSACMYFGVCGSSSPDLSSSYAIAQSPDAHVFGSQCQPSDLNSTMSPSQSRVLLFSIIVLRTVIFVRMCLVLRSISWDFYPVGVRREFASVELIIRETSESFRHLILVMFVLMYSFASVGMSIWGGEITFNNSQNPMQADLNGSLYSQSEYWPLNFNDMPSGLLTMFTLLYVNNMQVTASGFVAATSRWAELFFWLFYIVGVLLFMNIVTAFVWSRVAKVLDDDTDYYEEAEQLLALTGPAKEERMSKLISARNERKSTADQQNMQASTKGTSESDGHGSGAMTGRFERTLDADTEVHSNPARIGLRDAYPNRETGRDTSGRKSLTAKAHAIEEIDVNTSFFQSYFLKVFFSKVGSSAEEKSDSDRRQNAMSDWISGNVDIAPEERSAVLLQYARHGEAHTLFSSRSALRYFVLRCRLAYPLLFCAWLLTFIRIFQQPAWMLQNPDWNTKSFPVSMHPARYLSPEAACIIKFPLLAVLLIGLLLEILFKVDGGKRSSMFMPSLLARYLFFALTLFNMVLIIASAANVPNTHLADWYVSILSVLYIFWFDRNALRKVVIVLGVIPKVLGLAIVFVLFLSVMSLAASFIFGLKNLPHSFQDIGDDDYLGGGYYVNFSEAMWSTFVATTSSSFPSQLIPAYDAYREFGAFIVLLITLGSFVMLDITLATVNFEFQRGVRLKEVYEERTTADLIQNAFRILLNASPSDENVSEANAGQVMTDSVKEPLSPINLERLLDELYANFTDFRKDGVPDVFARAIFANILDIDGDGAITLHDFMYFLHCTKVKLKNVGDNWVSMERKNLLKEEMLSKFTAGEAASDTVQYPWHTRCIRQAKSLRQLASRWFFNLGKEGVAAQSHSYSIVRFMQSIPKRYWDTFGDSIAGLISLFSVLARHDIKYLNPYTKATVYRNMLIIFFSFCIVEFCLKWAFLGIRRYFLDLRNKIDFFLMFCVVVMFVIASLSGSILSSDLDHTQSLLGRALEIVVLLRLMVYPRNIACFANPVDGVSWDSILGTVVKLLFTFSEVFVCFAFTYAQVGCAIFGGKIPIAGINTVLDRSPYGQNNFYTLNFNDIITSLYTLFSCIRVSDFDTITSGLVAVTSKNARIYFVIWYVIGVLLLFNIVKSYFISVFQHRKKGTDARSGIGDGLSGQPEGRANDGNPRNTMNNNITGPSVSEADATLNSSHHQRDCQCNACCMPSADADELCERELSALEKDNVSSEFIIDLQSLSKGPKFISLSLRSNGTAAVEETPTHQLDQVRKTGLEEVLNPISSANDQGLTAPVDTSLQSIANDALHINTKFVYTARLSFVRDMDPRVRLDVLKRIKHLSDASRASLGRTLAGKSEASDADIGASKAASTSSIGQSSIRPGSCASSVPNADNL